MLIIENDENTLTEELVHAPVLEEITTPQISLNFVTHELLEYALKFQGHINN